MTSSWIETKKVTYGREQASLGCLETRIGSGHLGTKDSVPSHLGLHCPISTYGRTWAVADPWSSDGDRDWEICDRSSFSEVDDHDPSCHDHLDAIADYRDPHHLETAEGVVLGCPVPS